MTNPPTSPGKKPRNRSKATRVKAATARATRRQEAEAHSHQGCCGSGPAGNVEAATFEPDAGEDKKKPSIVISFVPDEYGGVSVAEAVNTILFTPQAAMKEDLVLRIPRSKALEVFMTVNHIRKRRSVFDKYGQGLVFQPKSTPP